METTESIFAKLRTYKWRLTKARKALILVLSLGHTPLSVAHILRELKLLSVEVNKTTVYRELERLMKLGIVESVQLGDRKQYFELASRDHHHHLICMECERVEDIDVNEKELLSEEHKASSEKKFTVLRHSLEFFGLCGYCQAVR